MSVKRHIAANTFPQNVEPLLWRLQWALLRVDDLYCYDRISDQFNDLFKSEITGALRREPFNERQINRTAQFLDKLATG